MGRKYGTLHQYRGRRKRKRSKPNVSTQVPLESNESAIVAVDPPFNGGDTPESDTSGNAARTSNDDDLQETNAQADESYIIASLEAINSLLGHVKCASCGAGDVKIVKGDRMYGLRRQADSLLRNLRGPGDAVEFAPGGWTGKEQGFRGERPQ
ncbi:hypothetical protein HPB47_008653 [Ixodes persulcatus]|uniref:Uncharacterized protein n=1 Tax=Ixodes persulcatus TaxID=34615 RepID=A0AC60P4C6_IXOPE|nr:hypothetical protein HPB47_008653 [Ixodes persulcatus]